MKKVFVIIIALMLSLVFVAPSFAGEGPIEAAGQCVVAAGEGVYKGTCWLLEKGWECAVWGYGATENTLETRKLSEPKWVEEEKARKKK